jgi:hypothetical protein
VSPATNPAHALDGGIPVPCDTARAWPAASDVQRSMKAAR